MISLKLRHPVAPPRVPTGFLIVGALLALAVAAAMAPQPAQPAPWVAPARAAKKLNPEHRDANSLKVGKKIFERECLSCHGAKGVGDGPKAADLERHPGNLAAPAMWDQTDGALFWKISEGNAPMPATKTLLSEDERWHVINYVRTLAPPESAPTSPQYAVPETHRRAISAVIRAYEPVRAALAGSGAGAAAAKALPALADAVGGLRQAEAGTLPDAARSTWLEDADACAAAVGKLVSAGDDIAKLREAFAALSASLVRVVERYGHAEAGPVFVFMETPAISGQTPLWVQTDAKAQDPFGAPSEKQTPTKRLAGQRSS
jgi:mono/diheme cytochrome c family protein